MQLSFIKLFIILTYIFFTSSTKAKETWIIDKELSTIEFEVPILFAKDVKGYFTEIDGLIELNIDSNGRNKAIFYVKIDSIEINHNKYKDLLLSNIFFDYKNYPLALLDTKSFFYRGENNLNLKADFNIKGISKTIPLKITITYLTDNFVQIESELTFSRNDFNIGIGKWSSTKILKDKITLKANLFLFKN